MIFTLTEINNLTTDLEHYHTLNNLKLNTSKTVLIIFHNKLQIPSNISHIKIANKTVPLNDSVYNLEFY